MALSRACSLVLVETSDWALEVVVQCNLRLFLCGGGHSKELVHFLDLSSSEAFRSRVASLAAYTEASCSSMAAGTLLD